jgi:hypothetical protein
MTQAAAIAAQLVDLRKVDPVPVAIARLDLSKVNDRPAAPRKPVAADKRLAQQAGILCSDPVFQQFLFERCAIDLKSEELAAAFVREYCKITSRAELVPETPAAATWIDLRGQFEAWRIAA